METTQTDLVPDPETAPATLGLCSKCGKPRDVAGYPKWCKECRAEWHREYRQIKNEMKDGKGFAHGVAAFRAMLVEEFSKLGLSSFEAVEVAHIIRTCTAPKPE